MDFSFLRNWFTTNTSVGDVSSKLDNAEQSNSSLIGGNIEKDDAFEIIEDYEFINPRDPNEIHSLPSSHQIDESIVEIAGFNKEKLLEMSNFSKISYGDDDNKLSEKRCNTLAEEVYKTGF